MSRTFVVNGKQPVFREGLGLEIHSISSMVYWHLYDADTFAMRRIGSFLLYVCHKHVFKHAMKTYMAEFNSDSFNQSGIEPRICVNCLKPLNSIETRFVSISSIDLLSCWVPCVICSTFQAGISEN